MARNAEKAMTTLARWRAAQVNEHGVEEKERRPYLASDCKELPKAEKWRMQIIREIARKVAQIQNAGLGEFRIRDLNDEINKLIREKSHWEAQIKELGGPDYARVGPRMLDHEGKEVPGNRGYKYFGAAKDLPGVRELFEQEPPPPPRKTRGELMKEIDADYYGYRDDDDGLLLPTEQLEEKKGCARGESVFIPRIPLIPSDSPIEFKRLQFPVKVCFAMTINKSQGQTLKYAGIDLRENCFSHGQFYVACSRVTSPRGLVILTPTGMTSNIVYKEVLK